MKPDERNYTFYNLGNISFLVRVPDQIIPIERQESTENRKSMVSESGTQGLTFTQLSSFIAYLSLDCEK